MTADNWIWFVPAILGGTWVLVSSALILAGGSGQASTRSLRTFWTVTGVTMFYFGCLILVYQLDGRRIPPWISGPGFLLVGWIVFFFGLGASRKRLVIETENIDRSAWEMTTGNETPDVSPAARVQSARQSAEEKKPG